MILATHDERTGALRRFQSYPAYKDSGVEWLGEIPAHWEVRRLKYVAPARISKLDVKPDDAVYVGLEHVDSWTGRLLLDNQPESVESVVGSFKAGDVLFGKLRPYLAKVARPDFDGVCSSEFLPLRPGPDSSQSYVMYELLNAPYIRWLDSLTYGTKMPRVSPDQVACSFVGLPPLAEQRNIAAFLDRETARIDALVAKKERLIALLQEQRTALVTRAVTKGLDPTVPMKDSGVEWLGEIPAHWEVKRLRHVGEAIIGLTYQPNDVVGPDEGVLVLRASNVSAGRLVYGDNVFVRSTVPDRLRTVLGDILICARSGSRDLIGKNARVDEGAVGQTFGTFMLMFRSACNPFLFYAFNSALFEYQSGTFLTSTINQLTVGNLKDMTVPVPPGKEQTAIAAFLDWETARIDNLVAKVRHAIDRLKELRTVLISAAVTGKIDVREEVA